MSVNSENIINNSESDHTTIDQPDQSMNNSQSVIEQLKAILTDNPHDLETLHQLTEIYYQQGELERAIALCQEILRQKPDWVLAYKTLGNILQAQDKVDSAIRAYNRAIALDPQFAPAYTNLGSIAYKMGEIDEAMILYRRAIALAPDHVAAYWNLGKTLEQQGRLNEGFYYQDKALQLSPDLAKAVNQGNTDRFATWEMDTTFSQLVCLTNPDLINTIDNSVTNTDIINPKIEQTDMSKKKSSQPQDKATQIFLQGNTCLEKQQFDQAIAKYQQAIQIKPHFAEAYCQLGMAVLIQARTNNEIKRDTFYQVCEAFERAIALKDNLALARQGWLDLIINFWLIGNVAKLNSMANYFAGINITQEKRAKRISPDQVVYLCLAPERKLTPELITAQIKILQQVTDSLLIYRGQANLTKVRNLYQKECLQQGVGCQRIKMYEEYTAQELDYRSLYLVSDVMLDTYPQNDVANIIESLWFNLPIVTYTGEKYLAKMNASFLQLLGINAGIANSWDNYINWGVKLGLDQSAREQLKQQIITSKSTSALWNQERLINELTPFFEQLINT
ncbi:MAG: tetratricopeptide repeat protein [Microcoleaceae cyanobacterium]